MLHIVWLDWRKYIISELHPNFHAAWCDGWNALRQNSDLNADSKNKKKNHVLKMTFDWKTKVWGRKKRKKNCFSRKMRMAKDFCIFPWVGFRRILKFFFQIEYNIRNIFRFFYWFWLKLNRAKRKSLRWKNDGFKIMLSGNGQHFYTRISKYRSRLSRCVDIKLYIMSFY